MNGFVIRTLAAASVAAWSSSALAQDEPPVIEIAPPLPPPPAPPVIRVVPPAPAPPPTVIIRSGPRRDVVTWEEVTPNADVISSGALMLGVAYGTSIVVAAGSGRDSDQFLYVPVAGPWMALAHRDECPGAGCTLGETTSRVLLVADGFFQIAGMAQILGGFLLPETRRVTRAAEVTKGVHVAPAAGRGSVGLSAYGAF